MSKEEIKKEYQSLYRYMSASANPAYMKAFGAVMNEMMDWFVANKIDAAEAWVEQLSAIKWDNYLTAAEAERIVGEMKPAAPWTREAWMQAMASLGFPVEEEPHYNRCALWAVMNMVYSDSGRTIANMLGVSLEDKNTTEVIRAIYALALDKLKDEDKRFNVRRYFGLL